MGKLIKNLMDYMAFEGFFMIVGYRCGGEHFVAGLACGSLLGNYVRHSAKQFEEFLLYNRLKEYDENPKRYEDFLERRKEVQ